MGTLSPTAALHFARGAGRTFLARQSVPYPFHVTRPHALEARHPDLVTLILQSASGGLYRGDRLRLDIVAREGALAQVTSQAATVVHASAGQGIGFATRLDVSTGAYLTVCTDPYILFPGTALALQTEIHLAAGGAAVVAEGFATHDPAGGGRPFGHLATRCRMFHADGKLLVDEASAIEGADFCGPGSPLGPYRAMGQVLILGEAATRFATADLDRRLGHDGVLAGATLLPNGAGLSVRLLASDGGRLAGALQAVAAMAFEARFGRPAPARRR